MPSTAKNTEQELATRQVILEAAYEEIHARGFQACKSVENFIVNKCN